MAIFGIGRLCVKVAGRDASKRCVIVEEEKDGTVLIDGETRRRRCNVKHLEPLGEILAVKKGASRSDVKAAFATVGVELRDTKAKKAAPRPKRGRKEKARADEKPAKSVETKTAAKSVGKEAKQSSKAVAEKADAKPAKPEERPAEDL